MEIENKVEVVTIDNDLQAKVQALIAEGWEMVPGVAPIAVYHLCRVKRLPEQAAGAFGKLKIDDSKIMIIPAAERTQ